MKKLALYFFLCTTCFTNARTISVCPECECKTVTRAVQKAGANDSVIIQPGTYKEKNIVIEKPLSLIGKNYPLLDGEGKYEVMTIRSSGVTITGLKINSSGKSSLTDLAAIKVYNASNVVITKNILFNNYFGIYLANCKNSTISENDVEGAGPTQQSSGNGIHLWKCNNIIISSNHIQGHRDGIYFEFVTESHIKSNKSEKNLRYGLHFMFSDSDTYEDNQFRNNGAGVAVMYTKNVTMIRNHFENSWGSGAYGLLLKDIRDSEIRENIFEGNTTGIYAESASRIKMHRNTLIRNGWAMRITASCDGMKITENNFIANTFDMASSSAADVTFNSFDGNYWDKYDGYDLNKDKKGDVPYYPISLSTMIVEKVPTATYFLHSFILELINQSEKVLPQLIPDGIRDNSPSMKKFLL